MIGSWLPKKKKETTKNGAEKKKNVKKKKRGVRGRKKNGDQKFHYGMRRVIKSQY